MSADATPGTDAHTGFVVRPDGTVMGDDGAGGALAAALPYTGRLARRMGSWSTRVTCGPWRPSGWPA